jgi:hypothetical protein
MPATLQRPAESSAVHSRQQLLEERVLLLAPSFSQWRGYYQLPKGELAITIGGARIDTESVTTNRAILMCDKYPLDAAGRPWRKRFLTVESRGRALIDRFSVPFPIHGVRLVPKSAGIAFFQNLFGPTLASLQRQLQQAKANGHEIEVRHLERRLVDARQRQPEAQPNDPLYDPDHDADSQSIAYNLHTAANEFVQDLPQILRQIEHNADPLVWDAVARKIPTDPVKMRAKFSLDVTPVELAGGGATRITQEDLTTHHDIVREACRRKVEEAVEEMVRGPRAELGEALAGLHKLIQDDGRVTSRSFAPVRAAIAKIKLFDFVADDQILASIRTLETRLDRTAPAELNSATAAASGFSAALESLITEVNDAAAADAAIQQFGRPLRSLDID